MKIIGIDATRNRSGGAISHMIGLIGAADPEKYGISKVHVWSYDELLKALPNRPWLVKHSPPELKQNILKQLYWQRWAFTRELQQAGCQVVLNTDAGTVGQFTPAVTISRDMLSYEPGEIERYGWTRARLRLWMLRYMQNASLRRAKGVIFLTQYASDVIQKSCGKLTNVDIVPHGVNESFRALKTFTSIDTGVETIKKLRCLYVSNTAPYKHQWMVVRAIASLRKEGFPIHLTLVGGGDGTSQTRLETQIAYSDPNGEFVTQHDFVPHNELKTYLEQTDIYIFASSCENMPNTLIEGMAAGLPVACSSRGPMPEVLRDSGIYFDPENPNSIADALRQFAVNNDLCQQMAKKSKILANKYSWNRCADETLAFLMKTYRE